jgi:predicted nucleic acid-binding protein
VAFQTSPLVIESTSSISSAVGGELLLDTSALVGLLDRSQTVHAKCVAFYEEWAGTTVTTEAVLTEATHLLSHLDGGVLACIDFVLRGTVLVPSTDISLKRCRVLIEKYSDLPMDFADATLVVLAEELNTDRAFTFDRDFRVYRIRGRKQFRVLPGPSA